MSQMISELYVKITAESSGLKKSLGDAKTGLADVEKQGKKSGGVIGDLTAKMAGLINPTALAAGAVTAITAGIVSSINVTQQYAREVRDLSAISGTSAEETSRLLQVLDDFEISAQDVTAATRAMTQQGLAPTTETVATLSDEYLKLNSAQERNEFVIKNLGRAGLEWVNVLNKGGDTIRDLGANVSESLILTEDAIQAAEDYRLAMDEWNDGVQALKISIGKGLIPTLTALISEKKRVELAGIALTKAEERGSIIVAGSAEQAIRLKKAHELAAAATRDHGEALMGAVNPLEAFTEQAIDAEMAAAAEAEAIQAVSDKNEAFLSVLGNVSGAMDDYQAAQSDANTALAEGKMTAEEHAAKMAELAGAYEEAKNRIVLSIVEMKLASDGWTNAELQSYLNIGEQLGVFDAEMVATTSSYIQQADKMVAAGGNQEIMFKRLAGRSDDAREEFINMKQSQAELADALRRDAVPAVGALNVALANIKDQQVYVDIFFREHGGSGATFTAPVIGGGAGYQTGIHLEGAGRALGGPLLENGYTIVGDSPGGWSPWAEVVTPDGKVLPHNVSQQLKDAGMLDDARRMAFGSADEVALYSPTQADYAIGNRNRAYRAYRASGSGVSAASMPAGAGDDIAAPAMYAAAADVMPNTNAGLVSTVHDGQVQQTNATGQTNELLKELIREIRKSKPPTAQEMAKATYEGSSKFS